MHVAGTETGIAGTICHTRVTGTSSQCPDTVSELEAPLEPMDDLEAEIQSLVDEAPEVLIASYVCRVWPTASRPALVIEVQEQERYVIKGAQIGRPIVTDQIVARLGQALQAPVGEPALIEISEDLIALDEQMSHFIPGLTHGTRYIPNCQDARDLRYLAKSHKENRKRLALLALLYGWAIAYDHQFLIRTSSPCLVYAMDHGLFLPGRDAWTVTHLKEAGPPQLDPFIQHQLNFTVGEVSSALEHLQNVSTDNILRAVASPPVEWGITIEERAALAAYFLRRQEQLLSLGSSGLLQR